MQHCQFSLFKSKKFLPLFITQFLGAFNDNAFKNAFLIWFTYDMAERTGINAPMMITVAAGLFILPFFLFSATAGQIADKYEKSMLAQKIKQIEIILMLLCAICFYFQTISGLLVILFLMGVQSTFFGPIKYSLLPEHLKAHELISGNGLIDAGTFLAILLGTIFGDLVIRTTYGRPLLSFAIILCAVLGWWSSYYIPKSAIADSEIKINTNIALETWKILGYARSESTVWLAILGISWFWFIGATFLTQFPIYTKIIIGGNEQIVTLFLSIFSIGISLGSMLCNRLLKSEINARFVPWGSMGISAAIILFTASTHFYVQDHLVYTHMLQSTQVLQHLNHHAFIGVSEFFSISLYSYAILFTLMIFSICSGIYVVPLYAIMQHRAHTAHLARIIAANNMLNAIFMVLASALAFGLFLMRLSVMEILLSVGLINIPMFFMMRGIIKGRLKHA
jgi:acyl-[acyl-carrier-protein]-phospholipid O-acyltransferase / long-chain-fatty-acid--[acyl-carrier-protein] ligase